MSTIWHRFFDIVAGGISGAFWDKYLFLVFTQGEDEGGGIFGNSIKTGEEEPISAIIRYVPLNIA